MALLVHGQVHLLLDLDVLHHGDRNVLVHRDRNVLNDRHLLDHRDFLHHGHVHGDVDFRDVVVVDGVHLVRHVDGYVLVAGIGNFGVNIIVDRWQRCDSVCVVNKLMMREREKEILIFVLL